MANVPISGLNAGTNVQSTDLFPDVQVPGVGPVKVTAAQIKTFMSDNPTFVNPNIGVAHGTSLALGGATIGTNSLAVTGTSNLSSVSAISLALGGASIGSNVFSAFGNVEINGDITQDNGSLYLGIQQASQGSIVLANTSAGAYPTTIKSSNSSTSATTYTLPTSDGTSGYVLSTDGSGNLSWIDSTTIVSGTTPTSGFTAGQILISDGSTIQAAGDAIATSIALNGATLGPNKLAITGSSLFTGDIVQDFGSTIFGVQQTTQGEIILANTAAGSYSTHIKSSNSSIENWTLTLPVNKGTNGYVLSTDGSGISSWVDPTTLGIDIDVGSTAITGGTSGHLVYDNSGTFGEISAITTDGAGVLTIGTQQVTQGRISLANTAVGAFSTVIESSNLSSVSWTLTLPATAGTNKYVLTTDGAGVSSWSQVDLTAGVTGVLTAANGGTGNSTNTIHGVLIGNAGSAINATSSGSAGQLLTSGGAAADPIWTTATYPSTATSSNVILIADGTNWIETTAAYPSTTLEGTILSSLSANNITSTSTPVLGIAGSTVGTISFKNATSGSIKIQPDVGALGASVITLPATTGTVTVLGNTVTGSGKIVLDTSPTLVTPSIGVAAGTSLALGGATIGSNNFAVTGTSLFSSNIVQSSGVYLNGSTTAYTINGINTWNLQLYGTASVGSTFARYSNDANSSRFNFFKSRGALGAYDIVQNGDSLGSVYWLGADGASSILGASIECFVDGVPALNSMPTYMTFSTTAPGASSPTQRIMLDSSGCIGIGASSSAGTNIVLNKNITGATTSYGFNLLGQTQSDVTSEAIGYNGIISVANSIFTLPDLVTFYAQEGAKGAAATITNQYGFRAGNYSNATNNYGFHSGVTAASGSWNFYASGTANNAYAGSSRFGSTTAPKNTVDISGSFGRGAPNTPTIVANVYTIASSDNWVIINNAATTTITLPSASTWTGREIMLITYTANTVVSASANVVPLGGGVAATAILAATQGKYATLVSDGTNWVIMQAN